MNQLQSAVDRVRSWSDEEYGQNLGVFLDEQPMLFSWLIRLSEEFDDDVHEQLVRSAMVLREGFRGMGLAVGTISDACITDVTTGVVEAFEALEEEHEVLELDLIEHVARSPFVHAEVRNFLHQELRSGLPRGESDQHNLMLVVDILIGCFEESVEQPGARGEA
ncbi:MAG: hypothetical protein RIR61_190 [Bacteroidota bacterium]|jgi:hypothetical protein